MTEPTRILAIRHGETAWNVDTRIQGQLDIPLNETGLWQAARLGEALSHEGIDAIYASDLLRAQATAQAISLVSGVPVSLDKGLRERAFGSFEGQTFAEIETRWPEDASRWRRRDVDFRPGGGESLRMFSERCVAAATRLASAHAGQTLVLVAHGGVMDCLYRAATRVELSVQRSWLLGNASVNRLLYSPEGFTLVGWSDNSHLQHESRDETGDRAGHAA